MNYLLSFSALLSLLFFAAPQEILAQKHQADDLVGIWEPSHGKGRVKIEKIGERYYGKIVWMKEPTNAETGEKRLDKNNPDAALRNRRILGLRVLQDFNYSGKGLWDGGTIYDPENGSTYSCKINMTDKNTLDIRGFVGVSVFGRTDVWRRLK